MFIAPASLALVTLLAVASLAAAYLSKKRQAFWNFKSILFPHTHESIVQRWIQNEQLNNSTRAVITDKAVEFIRARTRESFSVLIVLSYQFVGANRKGIFSLPRPVVELAVADPTEDLIELQSNMDMHVLVAREIYSVLKEEKVVLVVDVSGYWKFRRLELKPDLSWLLYSRQLRQLPPL